MPTSTPASGLLKPSSAAAASVDSQNNKFRFQERSPHPYHRRREPAPEAVQRAYLPSPTPTPSHSDGEDGGKGTRHRGPSRIGHSRTPSDSGSDGEGEVLHFVKALPPAPPKPRKGLKTGEDVTHDTTTPLLTPIPGYEGQNQGRKEYFEPAKAVLSSHKDHVEVLRKIARYRRKRNAELLRRSSEFLVLSCVAFAVLSNTSAWTSAQASQRELCTHLILFFGLCFAYIIHLILSPIEFFGWKSIRLRAIRIPSAFDPAPILYPPFLPVLVALSLVSPYPAALMPNIVLSLSALPLELIPSYASDYNVLHWLITLLPLVASEWTQWPLDSDFYGFLRIFYLADSKNSRWNVNLEPSMPYRLRALRMQGVPRETLALLYPLQQALLPPLQYLTTTSLLPAELQLFSICLIDLLLLSKSPQSIILGAIIWIGGLGVFILCGYPLRWNVALERIPTWRFQRAIRVTKIGQSFISSLAEGLASTSSEEAVDEHDHLLDEEGEQNIAGRKSNGTLLRSKSSDPPSKRNNDALHSEQVNSNNGMSERISLLNGIETRDFTPKRRSTVTSNRAYSPQSPQIASKRGRRASSSVQAYLSLTATQAAIRKWLYSLYTFSISILLILVPIRLFVQEYALGGQEPLGWAVGYLFGDLDIVRTSLNAHLLTSWISIPTSNNDHIRASSTSTGMIDWIRNEVLGTANTRLALFTYWFFVVSFGIASVVHLSTMVEVDTRRKVFHGMMVAMLLPTTFIDPTFLGLGLALVLAVFLLLDLFRAAQLRPLSKPLARFLTPYVDGRDLRGPVVISHMFLLIGCAIPLWLSLAGTERTGSPPWQGWELATRDVSMVAGVVCVGMGDAAASLIGRRYGRRKWPWAGGKSLEGSAAFAVAVTVGLVFAKVWLRVGGWETVDAKSEGWAVTLGKTVLAASGASFTEAVLTGCNDNVVVPIVLWLLVRGLEI